MIYGSNNLFNDVRDLYLQEFEQAKLEYNEKQTREDRKIKDYFNKISQDSQRDLACEILPTLRYERLALSKGRKGGLHFE